MKAGDAATQPETARVDTPLAHALAVMDETDCRYLTVLDDAGRALGYVTRARRAPAAACGERVTPFPAGVAADDNLRIVLSKMYQYSASWMPVLDPDGAWLGEITQDSIAAYLSSGRSRRQTASRPAARPIRSRQAPRTDSSPCRYGVAPARASESIPCAMENARWPAIKRRLTRLQLKTVEPEPASGRHFDHPCLPQT